MSHVDLCWEAVDLMRGQGQARSSPASPEGGGLGLEADLSAAIHEFREACVLRDAGVLVAGSRQESERRQHLVAVVKHLGRVLDDPGGLSRESTGGNVKREANDNEPEGSLSRDAYRKIRKNEDKARAAIAVAAYLLRAHAGFFCRSHDQRTFNAAKIALSDLHQAFQLAWRLYNSLPNVSGHDDEDGLRPYLREIAAARSRSDTGPGFVWNALLLCDVFRGNVYRQISVYQQADRYYRHAENRLDYACRTLADDERQTASSAQEGGRLLNDEFTSPALIELVSPTVIRAIFERSKVLFDRGQFLQSLRRQVRCLELVVLRQMAMAHSAAGGPEGESQGTHDTRAAPDTGAVLAADLKKIRAHIEVERGLPIFDRLAVTRGLLHHGTTPTIPRRLAAFVEPGQAPFVAAILSRIGFTLYTIGPRSVQQRRSDNGKLLAEFYRFDRVYSEERGLKIAPSRLGVYSETLFEAHDPKEEDASVFNDQIERRFALLLRRIPPRSAEPSATGIAEAEFYKRILGSVTQNIGNLITIPRRNQRVLMRNGYVHRRRVGDLGSRTVYDGLRASLELPPEPSGTSTRRVPRTDPGGSGRPSRHPAADVSGPGPANKLVVLRRWQSYNPKIPRSGGVSLRGGGYFLLWHGRGIVIDPGYGFIQTFYDEGFSLEDIDAIVVTHSHPDHDDDFATLTTLMKEWNDFHRHTGNTHLTKSWDFFLNESTHKKFSAWLQASNVEYGRIISLTSLWWNKNTGEWADGPFRGRSVNLDLRWSEPAATKPGPDPAGAGHPRSAAAAAPAPLKRSYDMVLEVVPAWHDDVIGRTAAVGLKFHLYDEHARREDRPICVVGYTGDTGAYGLRIDGANSENDLRIDQQYAECDVLVAHLGDVRLRELASVMEVNKVPWRISGTDDHPLVALCNWWFRDLTEEPVDDARNVAIADRIRQFLHFAVTLELLPSSLMKTMLPRMVGRDISIQDWLGEFVRRPTGPRDDLLPVKIGERLDGILDAALGPPETQPELTSRLKKLFEEVGHDPARQAVQFLRILCTASQQPWQYEFHLGIFGLFRLFAAFAERSLRRMTDLPGSSSRVFVVGEFPEELTSYRHTIACWLNQTQTAAGETPRLPAYAFTGDIGLHVGLVPQKPDNRNGTVSGPELAPCIRCAFCNLNNETALTGGNYHLPHQIKEVALKRQQASMIYLCTVHDHAPEHDAEGPLDFLSDPDRC